LFQIYGRSVSLLAWACLEQRAHVEDERPALVLDLDDDAAAADLARATVDARSRTQAAAVVLSTGQRSSFGSA